MFSTRHARSVVPLPQRSAFPTLPGVPAFAAVLIAVGFSFLGFVIDAFRGTELTRAFSVLFFIGCVVAAVMVRYRGLFTAVVQPPLLLFIAVPLAYQYLTKGGGSSFKDILLNVAIPLVNRFPLMLLTTLVVVGIGAMRVFLARQASGAAPERTRSRRPKPSAEERPAKAARGPRPARTPGPRPAANPAPRTGRNPRVAPPLPQRERPRAAQQPPRSAQPQRAPLPPRQGQPQRAPLPPRTGQPPRTPPPLPPRQRGIDDIIPGADGRRAAPRTRQPARSRHDIPAHPIPNVRYRDERPR